MSDEKTILLVEDQVIIAEDVKFQLDSLGYNVLAVYKGIEAVDEIRRNKNIDLILMDIDLGKGMDGGETARQILELRDMPIIFLSNHTEKEGVERTEAITSYGYVTKNSGIVVLDTSIKMAFRLFYAKKELAEELYERKHAEKALIDNESHYQSLFKSMDQGFYLADIIFNCACIDRYFSQPAQINDNVLFATKPALHKCIRYRHQINITASIIDVEHSAKNILMLNLLKINNFKSILNFIKFFSAINQ